MKNKHYTQSEIENLSAYLDHELTETEEAQLRTRLAQDANLRETLEDLRLTRYTLQHTPQVRRTRSFVLTPEMVRRQKVAWRAFSFSRTIAVAASVLFALVIGGEVFLGSGGMLSAASQENVAMDVYEEAAALEEEEAPMMMAVPSDEDTTADDAMDSEMMDTAEEAMPSPTETMETIPTIDPFATPLPPSGGGGMPPTETPTPSPTEGMKITEPTASEPIPEEMPAIVPGDGENMGAADSRMTEGSRNPADQDMMATAEEQSTEQIPAIRWIQVGLLVLALLGTGLALYFRRRVF